MFYYRSFEFVVAAVAVIMMIIIIIHLYFEHVCTQTFRFTIAQANSFIKISKESNEVKKKKTNNNVSSKQQKQR